MDKDFSLLLHSDVKSAQTTWSKTPKSSCVGRLLKWYIIFWASDEFDVARSVNNTWQSHQAIELSTLLFQYVSNCLQNWHDKDLGQFQHQSYDKHGLTCIYTSWRWRRWLGLGGLLFWSPAGRGSISSPFIPSAFVLWGPPLLWLVGWVCAWNDLTIYVFVTWREKKKQIR